MSTAPLRQRDLFTRRWRKLAEPQKEAAFHIQLVSMLRWCLRPDVLFWHTPNGEMRDVRVAQKLKAMGTLPGISDLQFHWVEIDDTHTTKRRRVLHLELKIGKRPQNDAQIAFALAMKLLGDEYHVARSIDEAIIILGERGLIRSGVEVCGRRW